MNSLTETAHFTDHSLWPARRVVLFLLFVYAVAVGTHLWVLWPGAQFPHISSDESQYAMTGENVLHGNGYSLRGEFNASLPPVVPMIVALAHGVGETPRQAMFVTACLLMCAAVFPAFLLARRIGLGMGEALLISAAAGFLPHTVYAATYMAEIANYPLGLLAIYLAIRWLESPSRRSSICLGVCLGVMLLTKVAGVNLVVAFLIAAVAGTIRRYRENSDEWKRWTVQTALVFSLVVLIEGLWILFKLGHKTSALGVYGSVLSQQGLPYVSLSLFLAYFGDYLLAPGLLVATPLAFWFSRAWFESRDRAVFLACALTIPLVAVGVLDGGITGWLRERLLTNYLPVIAMLAVGGMAGLRAHPSVIARLALPAAPVMLLGLLVLYRFHVSPILETPWAYLFGAFTGVGTGAFSVDRLILSSAAVIVGMSLLLLRLPAARSGLALAAFVLSFHTVTFFITAQALKDWSTIGLRYLSPIAEWLDSTGLKAGDRLLVSGRRNYFESQRADLPSDGFYLDWTWQMGLSEFLVWQLEVYRHYDVRMIPSPDAVRVAGKNGDYYLATTLMQGAELVGSHAPLYLFRIRDANGPPIPRYSTGFDAGDFFTMAGRRGKTGLIEGTGSGEGFLVYGPNRPLPRGHFRVSFQMEGPAKNTVALEVVEGESTVARANARLGDTVPVLFSTKGGIPLQFRVVGTSDESFRFRGVTIDYLGDAVTTSFAPAVASHPTNEAAFSRTATGLGQLHPVLGGGCFVDKVNMMPPSSRVSVDRNAGLKLEGWVADTSTGEVLPTVLVELTSAANVHYFAQAPRNPRPDVVIALKKATLERAGFSLTAKVASLPKGIYSLRLIQTDGRKAQACEMSRAIELR